MDHPRDDSSPEMDGDAFRLDDGAVREDNSLHPAGERDSDGIPTDSSDMPTDSDGLPADPDGLPADPDRASTDSEPPVYRFSPEQADLNQPRRLIFHRIDPSQTAKGPKLPETDSPDAELPVSLSGDAEFLAAEGDDQPGQEIAAPPIVSISDRSSDDVSASPAAANEDDHQDDALSQQVLPPATRDRKREASSRRADPIVHSVIMLATVLLMLAAARFVVPGIVEEIRYAQRRGQLRAEYEVAGEGLRNVSLDSLSHAYQMVTAAAGPSVVHIDVHRPDDAAELFPRTDFLGAPSTPISDQGSGVVVDEEGYILTNRHVIVGGEKISVTLSDGRRLEATVAGTDLMTDLAVLKIDADQLMPIRWGDSDQIQVGSPVWAIGSPFGLERTVTFGILSGKHRVVRASDRYQDFMQSDVAVNPGNSGGPLVDSHGTLIGINTAIVGDTYQGVSFSIPSRVAKKIYLRLRETGKIERGYLGVSLQMVPDELLHGDNHRVRGALIAGLAGSPSGAAAAGLRAGDIVKSVDGEAIRDVPHLMEVIGNAMAGTTVRLAVVRDDDVQEFRVTLGKRPEPPIAR